MRSTYRVLAFLVAACVAVQAAAIAMGFFGIIHEMEDGGAITSSYDWEGNLGVMIHRYNGSLIALLVIALLVVSFFTRAPGAVRWAAALFGLVLLQFALLFPAFAVGPTWGGLHGLNALLILGTALQAGRRITREQSDERVLDTAPV
jgi:heme A synthase